MCGMFASQKMLLKEQYVRFNFLEFFLDKNLPLMKVRMNEKVRASIEFESNQYLNLTNINDKTT